jgi:hypothetical protein
MNKSEFYKSIIDIHKKTGQGLSGIVKIKSKEFATYLDEFIDEGLIEACHSGTSIGHPESNIFYMPTKGYNVWNDNPKNLSFVRLYLGQKDEYTSIILSNPDLVKNYSEWLAKNQLTLEEMKNLSDFYVEKVIKFSDEELDYIKSRDWHKNNLIVKECLELSNDRISTLIERIQINKKIINLCGNYERFDDTFKQATNEIKDDEKEINLRKKIDMYLREKNQSDNIKNIFKIVEQ